jgi:hypothetical protein
MRRNNDKQEKNTVLYYLNKICLIFLETNFALIHENYQDWPQEILTPLSVEPIYDSTYISGQALIADINTIVA